MTLRVGHPSKKGNTDTSDARLDFRNRYVCNADGSPRGGVTSPVGVALLSSTSTMNVSVSAFSAVTVRDGGVVEMANDGPVSVLLDAPPSSQSRIDVVFVKQNDSSSTVSVPDANDLPVFGVLKGNASATPVKRTDLPAGAEEIGTVLIPSTATATNSPGVVITTTCRFTAASGGKVPFRTLVDLQAWTTAMIGQAARVLADSTAGNNTDYVWSGSVWFVVPGRRLVPSSVSGGTVNGDGSISVTGSRLNLDGLLTQANIVKIEGTVSIGSNQILFARLRSGGSDISSNTAQQLSYAAAGTGTAATAQNPSGTGVWQLGVQQASWHHFTLLLSNAGQALPTIGNVDVDTYASLTSMTKVSSSLFQVDASARDGIGIGAGSITGTAAMSGTVFCTAIA